MHFRYGIKVECCPVPTLKKFATGHGGANKNAMARYLTSNPRFCLKGGKIIDRVTWAELDDDAVDALHLLQWAKTILRNLKKS